MALIEKLSAIGEPIRTKTGKTDLLTLDEMPTEMRITDMTLYYYVKEEA